MSPGAMDVVRSAYESFARGDVEAIVALCEPDFEGRDEPELPDPRLWAGHDGVREYFSQSADRWDDLGVELRELREAEDGLVLARGVLRARGSVSGAGVEAPFAHVYELRDGKLARAWFYFDTPDALERARQARRSDTLAP